MIRPHYPNATATALIKGLAIARFNENQSRWEVRFLRNCGHYPQLRIKQLSRRDGRVLSTVRTYEIASGDSLSVTVEDARPETKPRYRTGEEFNRNNTAHDAHDLRWMLDIDQLHGKKTRERDDPVETNFLSISDGCFYTAVRTRRNYRKRWVDASGRRSALEPIGISGRTFGVDFEGKSVTIEVSGKSGFSETLEHKEDSRYEIVFDNTCFGEKRPEAGETDFHDYYKLIDDSEGRVEIVAPDEGEEGEPPPDEPEDDDPPKIPICYAITSGENQ